MRAPWPPDAVDPAPTPNQTTHNTPPLPGSCAVPALGTAQEPLSSWAWVSW